MSHDGEFDSFIGLGKEPLEKTKELKKRDFILNQNARGWKSRMDKAARARKKRKSNKR